MPTYPSDQRSDRPRCTGPDQGARDDASRPEEPCADEQAFDAFAQGQDPLDIAAATWVTRQHSGLSAEGEAELQAWLNADPRHAQAFDDMNTTWDEVQRLPDDDVAQLRAGMPAREHLGHALPAPLGPATAPRPRTPPAGGTAWGGGASGLLGLLRPLMPQAAAAAIALAMAAGGLTAWNHWQRQAVFTQAYATQRGQQLQITLPDTADQGQGPGSTLQLDTATQTQVRLYRDRREVQLHSGQAMFLVHGDVQRPFHVFAGALRITVVGTRFSVRHTGSGLDAGQTVVAVEEGRVQVGTWRQRTGGTDTAQDPDASTDAPADHPVELVAGQTVVADAQGHMGPVQQLAPEAIAPWRDGRLNFDQTPLKEAIAEFERYGRTGLLVRDPAVAALPVGGSYSLRQWQRFAETLPQVLPVRLVRRGEVTEVVAN